MSTSFIHFNDNKKGFWISDTLMEYALFYLNETISKKDFKDDWILQLNLHIEKCRKGYFPSFLNLMLDYYLVTDSRKRIFISFLDEAILGLKKKGDFISVDEISNIMSDKIEESRIDVPQNLVMNTSRLVLILDHLILLVKDEIEEEIYLYP